MRVFIKFSSEVSIRVSPFESNIPEKGENMTKKSRNIFIAVLSFMFAVCGSLSAYSISVSALNAPVKEEAKTLLTVYEEGLGEGMKLVWGESNTNLSYVDSSDKQNTGSQIAVDCTKNDNTEFYIDFGKEYDIYSGKGFLQDIPDDFYKKTAIEFFIKLNAVPASFFNIYLFQSRGPEYASAPANQRYIRSNVQLKTYVDTTVIGEWQFVQVPLTAFSSVGEYVNEKNVKVTNAQVDLTKVCAIGFAHMLSDKTTTTNPTVQYDDMKFVYANMDDENLGVTVVSAKEYESRKKSATFTPIDIRSLATTGYYGGSVTFINSNTAYRIIPERAAYSASKGGQLGLMRALAFEFGKYDIRVNAVLPGMIHTDRTDKNPEFYKNVPSAYSPLGRMTEGADIADAVWYFAAHAKNTTGAELVVDCGNTIQLYPIIPGRK